MTLSRAGTRRLEALEVSYGCERGTSPACGLHILERGPLAKEERFHRAVAAVSHPAAQAALDGLTLDEGAETHALHAAGNHQSDSGHPQVNSRMT